MTPNHPHSRSSRPSNNSRYLLLALGVLFVPAILTFLILSARRPPVRPPLPYPNGYDDFLKAAALVNGDAIDATNRDTLRASLTANAEPLRLIRLGLTRQCLMPTDAALTNAAGMMNQLGDMKRLCQLLVAEGRLREMENQPGDAARSYADAIRFGNEISRGGFLITRLVGIACETMGCRTLARVVPKLGREDSRPILAELEKVDAGRVTWAEVLRNEQYYVRSQLRNRMNPILWVAHWLQSRLTIQAMQKAESKDNLILAQEHLLAVELALRCYQSERARVPAELDDLVPNYLSKVPQDPFTGQPLIYRSQGTKWLLYRVGEDGVEDGGKPAGRRASGTVTKGDLFYDSL
jgi:hypothetical protein